RRAVVRVAEDAGRLVVAVDDDGRTGKAPALTASGNGLRGMAERAAACGGRLDIARSELGGWSVRAPPACRRDGRPGGGAGRATPRVLVADDQARIRVGLRMILDNEPDRAVVAEAADGLQAVSAAASARPDVVLMDVRMPLLDGLEATRRIVASSDAPPRVLVLTTFDDDEYLFDALPARARA